MVPACFDLHGAAKRLDCRRGAPRPRQLRSLDEGQRIAMDAPHPKEAPEAEREMRRELYELAETQRWVHHVADLDSGEIVTTPLDRPVTPLSRAERLSQLGHLFHPEVFDGPSQRLTPRQHYQPSGQGWAYLSALEPTLYAPAFPWGTDGTIFGGSPASSSSP
jgi:hypothetical protein